LHAPLLPDFVKTSGSVLAASGVRETSVAEWKNPIWTLAEVVRNLRGLGIVGSVALPVILVFLAIGTLHLARRQPIFTAIFLTNLPLTLIALRILGLHLWPRYFFLDLGFILLCVVHGVFTAASHLAKRMNNLERLRLNGERLGVMASSVALLGS